MARIIPQSIICLLFISEILYAAPLVMTRPKFNAIQLQEDISTVIKSCGEPQSLEQKGDFIKYQYLERIAIGGEMILYKYVLTVKEGKVVSKEIQTEQSPSYDEIYEEDPNEVH